MKIVKSHPLRVRELKLMTKIEFACFYDVAPFTGA